MGQEIIAGEGTGFRQKIQDAALLLAFLGIFCLSLGLIHLKNQLTAYEKAQSQQQLQRQLQKSPPQSKSPNQSSEGQEPGEPESLIPPIPSLFLCGLPWQRKLPLVVNSVRSGGGFPFAVWQARFDVLPMQFLSIRCARLPSIFEARLHLTAIRRPVFDPSARAQPLELYSIQHEDHS
jgi:hypothetical protein